MVRKSRSHSVFGALFSQYQALIRIAGGWALRSAEQRQGNEEAEHLTVW
jgi:hypothetical protein